jgi:peptidoglycan/LPS O-acetylase OafA/YrhL
MSEGAAARRGNSDRSDGGLRLPVIDLLRGVAALAVVCVHLPFSWSAVPSRIDLPGLGSALPLFVTAVTDYGRFGVHLFLIISGFCIHLRVARGGSAAGVDFVRFWRRRLTRLYPPYFFALLASIAGLFVLFAVVGGNRTWPGMFGYESSQRFLLDLLQLVTLTQNLSDASQRVGNGPFWTLALEEQLYFLYFVLLLLRRRLGWRWTLASIAAVTFAWRALPLVVPGLPGEWNVLGPARWLEWALGALAVEAFFGTVHLPRWSRDGRAAVALLGLAVLVNVPSIAVAVPALSIVSDAAFGVAFFAIVNWACAFRARELRQRPLQVLAAVGLFSYSLYLTHEPVIVGTKQLALRLGLTPGVTQTAVMLGARLAIAIAVGYLFYRLIEIRAIRASRRLRGPVVSPSRQA